MQCGFLNIKPHCTMWCGAVRCTITCGAVWLCHFADDFGVIFAICAVYAIWWTLLPTATTEYKISSPYSLFPKRSKSWGELEFHLERNSAYFFLYSFLFSHFPYILITYKSLNFFLVEFNLMEYFHRYKFLPLCIKLFFFFIGIFKKSLLEFFYF